MNRKKMIEDAMDSISTIRRRAGLHTQHYLIDKNKLNISPSEGQIIHILQHYKKINIKQLSQFTGTTSSATTQLVDSLVEKDMVNREIDETDRRSVTLTLTKNANNHINEFRKFHISMMAETLKILNDDELENFNNLCQKILSSQKEGTINER
jgi:DNA-binding MarR family transcriptional regulator